jgi:hypothetical protein
VNIPHEITCACAPMLFNASSIVIDIVTSLSVVICAPHLKHSQPRILNSHLVCCYISLCTF